MRRSEAREGSAPWCARRAFKGGAHFAALTLRCFVSGLNVSGWPSYPWYANWFVVSLRMLPGAGLGALYFGGDGGAMVNMCDFSTVSRPNS